MMSDLEYLETSRKVWGRASGYSATKEAVYPDHARVGEFDSHRGKVVLEYGCGGGSDTMSFLSRGCLVSAVDICATNIITTRDRIKELMPAEAVSRVKVELIPDSAPLPFPDGMFDVINCHGVLHHIVDPGPVLDEFARVLKPDGLAYIMLYTEKLFQALAPGIVHYMNHRAVDVWTAFGWMTDGEGVPYARAYDLGAACYLLAPNFNIRGYREYNEGAFRTFKLASWVAQAGSLPPSAFQMDVRNLDAA